MSYVITLHPEATSTITVPVACLDSTNRSRMILVVMSSDTPSPGDAAITAVAADGFDSPIPFIGNDQNELVSIAPVLGRPIPFSLVNDDRGGMQMGSVVFSEYMLSINIDGCSDYYSHTDNGSVAILQPGPETPELLVYEDINSADPTSVLDFSGARITARKGFVVPDDSDTPLAGGFYDSLSELVKAASLAGIDLLDSDIDVSCYRHGRITPVDLDSLARFMTRNHDDNPSLAYGLTAETSNVVGTFVTSSVAERVCAALRSGVLPNASGSPEFAKAAVDGEWEVRSSNGDWVASVETEFLADHVLSVL